MNDTNKSVTIDHLIRDLQQLGLRPGDTVYAHTSLKRIGWVEGGANALIDAFLEVLGAHGTLAVPTHTLSFVDLGVPPYDPAETPTYLGALPNAVWSHPSARRSGHASHSSAAIGEHAAYLTENHDPRHALGENSPLHRLYRMGGRILLLGVTHKVNTSLHLAESLSGVPYVRLGYDASWGSDTHALEEGAVVRYTQVEYPGCSSGFDRIAPYIPSHAAAFGKIGYADSILVDAQPLIHTAIERLKAQPDFFLCNRADCPCCPARRKMLRI